MDVRPVKTEEDYRATLREVESLMNAEPESSEGERLDVLVTLVEAYERQHFPMDQRGLTVKDLEPMIGPSNRVYEILAHKRPLTLKMIWKLHNGLGIPAECLINAGELPRRLEHGQAVEWGNG
jgi:HTH-type transcriptional regulator/antitoxin HigA